MALTDFLTSIADAIRYAEGSTGEINAQKFAERIRALSGSRPVSPTLSSITAAKTKTEYTVNDTLNIDDITVTANYSDGSSNVVSGWTSNIDDVDMSSEGTKTLTISYTENEITKTASINIMVSAATPEPEPSPIVPQTGTWQLKTTTGKKYIILGTDDDNNGNTKYFRLLRTYGFPYTMNVEAENANSTRMLGSDVDDTIFTDTDAPALFPDGVDVITLGKYLHDNNLGEVAQHGASGKTLWDSSKLTGDFLTQLHETYTDAGGTKTEEELKAAIMEQLKDTDGSQDASYVATSRDALKEAFGFPIKTVGIWGGSPSAVIDGITLDLNTIKNTTNYNWRKHNYTAVCATLQKEYIDFTNPWNIPRISNSLDSVLSIIDTIPAGKACEFFWHQPFNDEKDISKWRTLFTHIKELIDADEVEVITRSKYAELGEFVANPVTKITVKSSRTNITVGQSDAVDDYTVTATYADGNTENVTSEAIIDRSAIDVSTAGKYTVIANYRGFVASVDVSVIEAQNYTIPEGLKDKDYWFIFKDNTKNMYFAGNTTATFGEAGMSSGILAFINCTAGNMNGWKSSDGTTWEQTDTNEIHSKTIKTTSGEKIFDFGLSANDSITWLETSGNFEITYGS